MRWPSMLMAGMLAVWCSLAWAGQDRAVYVELRGSGSPDAPIVKRQRLYGASYGLVIGIDNYSAGWPKLSNAIKDAQLVGDALEAHGFSVERLFENGLSLPSGSSLDSADLSRILDALRSVPRAGRF